MGTVIAASRRLGALLYSVLILIQMPGPSEACVKWARAWWFNRGAIVLMTGVNTAITTGSEYVTRTLSAPLTSDYNQNSFFVRTPSDGMRINRQSLINILMTLFASLLGGPVFFIRRRLHRFLFFIGFGAANSFLSQCIVGLVSFTSHFEQRLLFDLVYTGTIKFFMFEVGLPLLLRWKQSVSRVGATRVAQDVLMTNIRVFLLNAFNIKG